MYVGKKPGSLMFVCALLLCFSLASSSASHNSADRGDKETFCIKAVQELCIKIKINICIHKEVFKLFCKIHVPV